MTASPETDPASGGLPGDHWVVAMGLELVSAPPQVSGFTRIEPGMLDQRGGRVRLGILATMIDVVAGHVPDGARTPTIDLRVQLAGPPPTDGPISLRARPLKVGRRLIVSHTDAHDESGAVFATATTTFMNQRVPIESLGDMTRTEPMTESFEELMAARVLDAASLELDPSPRLSNGPYGTVQGGAQAFLAELTAEHLLAGQRATAVDLDIRYLNRLRTGPLQARAEVVGTAAGRILAHVTLTDAADDRIVSQVSLAMTTDQEPAS